MFPARVSASQFTRLSKEDFPSILTLKTSEMFGSCSCFKSKQMLRKVVRWRVSSLLASGSLAQGHGCYLCQHLGSHYLLFDAEFDAFPQQNIAKLSMD